jgi:hypothetical protein
MWWRALRALSWAIDDVLSFYWTFPVLWIRIIFTEHRLQFEMNGAVSQLKRQQDRNWSHSEVCRFKQFIYICRRKSVGTPNTTNADFTLVLWSADKHLSNTICDWSLNVQYNYLRPPGGADQHNEDRDGPWNAGFFSPFNQLTRIVAQGHFIIQSLRESYKSYKCERNFYITGVSIMNPLQ